MLSTLGCGSTSKSESNSSPCTENRRSKWGRYHHPVRGSNIQIDTNYWQEYSDSLASEVYKKMLAGELVVKCNCK